MRKINQKNKKFRGKKISNVCCKSDFGVSSMLGMVCVWMACYSSDVGKLIKVEDKY